MVHLLYLNNKVLLKVMCNKLIGTDRNVSAASVRHITSEKDAFNKLAKALLLFLFQTEYLHSCYNIVYIL